MLRMRRRLLSLTFVALLGVTTAAETLVCTAKLPNTFLLRPGRAREFYSLMDQKLFEEAARCCVACMVSAGTKLVIVDSGFVSHTVRVVEGPFRDCRGDVAVEHIQCR